MKKSGPSVVESLQNPYVKFLCQLKKRRRWRRQSQSIYVEGCREIRRALENNWKAGHLFLCLEFLSAENRKWVEQIISSNSARFSLLSSKLYRKLAIRSHHEGLLAVLTYQHKERSPLLTEPCVVILNSVEKPGNLGAICRTLYAVGIRQLFLTGESVDLYHPVVIRNSLGSVFGLSVHVLSNEETFRLCIEAGYQFYIATSRIKRRVFTLYEQNFSAKTALVFGNEARGIDAFWERKSFSPFVVPMCDQIDSLNLSVSMAVVVYELYRQGCLRRESP